MKLGRVKRTPGPWATRMAELLAVRQAEAGLSIREHAREMGLSYGTLQRIMQGHGCDIPALFKVQAATHMTFDQLLNPSPCNHDWVVYDDPIHKCSKCGDFGV